MGGLRRLRRQGLETRSRSQVMRHPVADLQTKSWNGVMGGYLFERTWNETSYTFVVDGVFLLVWFGYLSLGGLGSYR
jgi:hypothetical protein